MNAKKSYYKEISTTKDGKKHSDKYDFNEYTNLPFFANNIFKGRLSIEEARNEQKEMKEKMDKLENRINKKGPGKKLSINNKKDLNSPYENAQGLYNLRGFIIDELGKKSYLKWVKNPKEF